MSPATSMPSSRTTPAARRTARPGGCRARAPPGRSAPPARVTISGSDAIRIAVSDELMWLSPIGISVNGIADLHQAERDDQPAPLPDAAQRALAPGERQQDRRAQRHRAHATKTAGRSSTATLMKKYGIPQRIEQAAKAIQARRVMRAQISSRASSRSRSRSMRCMVGRRSSPRAAAGTPRRARRRGSCAAAAGRPASRSLDRAVVLVVEARSEAPDPELVEPAHPVGGVSSRTHSSSRSSSMRSIAAFAARIRALASFCSILVVVEVELRISAGSVRPWTTTVKTTTANARKIRGRARGTRGSASAAASVTAPRMPVHAIAAARRDDRGAAPRTCCG